MAGINLQSAVWKVLALKNTGGRSSKKQRRTHAKAERIADVDVLNATQNAQSGEEKSRGHTAEGCVRHPEKGW